MYVAICASAITRDSVESNMIWDLWKIVPGMIMQNMIF